MAWLVSKHVCLDEIVQNSHSNLGVWFWVLFICLVFLFSLLRPCILVLI